MKLGALNRSVSSVVQNQKASWPWPAGGRQWLNHTSPELPDVQHTPPGERPGKGDARPKIRVEDIEVSADREYMYCKGCLRSQGFRSRSNVVVAVEWLGEDHQALNTDWKRIEMRHDGQPAPLLPNTMCPFTVKAPLDRRVKWVKAYAFSSNH